MTKVFYNSKLAKLVTFFKGFGTIMLFGSVFTEYPTLGGDSLTHEKAHVYQYRDCFFVGMYLFLIILFGWAILVGEPEWWMLALPLIPIFLFYILYGLEYLYWVCRGKGWKGAYDFISFERHAYWIEETWNLPVEQQNPYCWFGWWRKNFGKK